MRLVTFRKDGLVAAGAVVEDGVLDLSRRLGTPGIRDVLETGRLAEARAIAATENADWDLVDIDLELPVPDARKVLCVGVNYRNRNEEYRDGSDTPTYPSIFVRTPLSFSPHGAPILIPPESEQLDYEGEIVLVIGRGGRRIQQAHWREHVAGLTIMNEGSVRDWVRHGKFNVTPGKNFDRSGGLGPWIETDLDSLPLEALKVETHVNGELRQSDSTASMAFPFARIVEYVSTFATLLPGDLIATGTPTGSGARFDPPRWLREGDRVDVTVQGVGTLTNFVSKETLT